MVRNFASLTRVSNFEQTPAVNGYSRGKIKGMPMRTIWSGVLIAASTAVGMTDVYAQGTEYGKNDYIKACATCHGVTGKGRRAHGQGSHQTAAGFDEAFGIQQRRVSRITYLRRDRRQNWKL